MIKKIAALFQAEPAAVARTATHDDDDKRVAAAALLIEAAMMDSQFDDDERATIAALVQQRFDLEPDESEELIARAARAVDETQQLYRFTRVINDTFAPEERVELIEMLWAVVYADGELHHYEANLLRRVAGLLYVSDKDRGLAKRRVLQRLGLS